MVQWDQQHLGVLGQRFDSQPRHSGLRIQHCSSCDLGHNCGSDLIPGLGIPYASGRPKVKGLKKKSIPKENTKCHARGFTLQRRALTYLDLQSGKFRVDHGQVSSLCGRGICQGLWRTKCPPTSVEFTSNLFCIFFPFVISLRLLLSLNWHNFSLD